MVKACRVLSGVDIIEAGDALPPHLWPTGRPIQLAGQRALEGWQTLDKNAADQRSELRKVDQQTPFVMYGLLQHVRFYFARPSDTFLVAGPKEAGFRRGDLSSNPAAREDVRAVWIPAQAAGLNFNRLDAG